MTKTRATCACGCGNETRIATRTRKDLGHIKGQSIKYINGHNQSGENQHNWNGGRYINAKGYVYISAKSHPNSDVRGYVAEHVLIAEKALGRILPDKVIVHHHSPDQLVICQNQAYHNLLHQRQRAYETCGHANWLKCGYCGLYDDPVFMYQRKEKNKRQAWHKECSYARRKKS